MFVEREGVLSGHVVAVFVEREGVSGLEFRAMSGGRKEQIEDQSVL